MSYYIAVNQIDKIYEIYKKLFQINSYFKMNIHAYSFHSISFLDYTQNKIERMTLIDNIQDFIGSKFITQEITSDITDAEKQVKNLCIRIENIING